MDALENVFAKVGDAKALGGFTSRLAIGSHTLLLKRFNVKESAKGKGKIVEADFTVLESTTANPGETKGWAWFIGAAGFAGQYEEARLKGFIETVGACIGDSSEISTIGASLAGPAQAGRGLTLKCVVSAQTERDGSPKKSPKGEIYTQIDWLVVPQTLDDIEKARKLLAGGPAPKAEVAAAPAPVAQPAPVAAAPATAGVAGLLSKLNRT